MVFINGNCLDTGGAQLQTQAGVFVVHRIYLLDNQLPNRPLGGDWVFCYCFALFLRIRTTL